jgi:hypothetical protein
VAAHDDRVKPLQLHQSERLGIVARRDLDLVTRRPEARDDRPEDHGMR